MTLERGLEGRAEGSEALEEGLALTASANAELDFLAWELRPAVLDGLGLAAALPRFVEEWAQRYGVRAEFRLGGFESNHLSREQEVAFYRIAQESLNNVVKHAHATRVDMVLETRNGTVSLVVADNGVGFEPDDHPIAGIGFGLVGMKERATLVDANFEIESSIGAGTTVYLRCPVQPHRGPEESSS
jgi:signal transduction histidine kinase